MFKNPNKIPAISCSQCTDYMPKVLLDVIKKLKESSVELTDGNATVGATEVDVTFRDGGHSELVVGSAEECGESAGEHHVTVPDTTADRHAHLDEGGRRDARDVTVLRGLLGYYTIEKCPEMQDSELEGRVC